MVLFLTRERELWTILYRFFFFFLALSSSEAEKNEGGLFTRQAVAAH